MYPPNLHAAEIPERKISGYLSSTEHPSGRGKARFFISLGFRPDQPETLHRALLQLAAINKVGSIQQSQFGAKYLIDGRIIGPVGQFADIRSVWFIEAGRRNPRLITVYPSRGIQT